MATTHIILPTSLCLTNSLIVTERPCIAVAEKVARLDVQSVVCLATSCAFSCAICCQGKVDAGDARPDEEMADTHCRWQGRRTGEVDVDIFPDDTLHTGNTRSQSPPSASRSQDQQLVADFQI